MTREPSSSSRRDLHSFGGGADGEAPIAGLFDANGVLCGTTAARGKYSDGTAFAMATAGSERVLRNFGFCIQPIGGNDPLRIVVTYTLQD